MRFFLTLSLIVFLVFPSLSSAISVYASEADGGLIECLVIKTQDELPAAIAITAPSSGLNFSDLGFSNENTLVGLKQTDGLLTILIASREFQQPIDCISGEDGVLARLYFDSVGGDWVLGAPEIEVIHSGDMDIDFAFQVGEDPPGANTENPTCRLSIYPNPGNAHFTVSYLGNGSEITGQIFDVTGARVQAFDLSNSGNGEEISFEWDGRNQSGQELSSGVYFISIRDDLGQRVTERLILMK